MTSPAFVVALADLERGAKQVHWTISTDWLRHALADTEAEPREDGTLDLELSKTGHDVMVRGRAHVNVTMPCSRTLEPVHIELDPEIFLLLSRSQALEAAGEGRGRARHRGGRRQAGHEPAQARRRGPAGRREPGSADSPLSDEDAARDTFVGEQVTLDPFVREFILLELPMFPMRSDLPSDAPAAIAPASPETESEGLGPQETKPRRIDPRLAPLAEIANRLKSDKE